VDWQKIPLADPWKGAAVGGIYGVPFTLFCLNGLGNYTSAERMAKAGGSALSPSLDCSVLVKGEPDIVGLGVNPVASS